MASRLIDKLLVSPYIRVDMKLALKRTPVIIADNISSYVTEWCTRKGQIEQDEYLLALPEITPSFKEMFIQFRVPEFYHREFGALITRHMIDSDECYWLVDVLMVYADVIMGAFRVPVDEHGKIILNSSIDPCLFIPDERYTQLMEVGISAGRCTQQDIREDQGSLGLIILWTLAFMNCKNAILELVEPNAQENKRRAKHGKLPLMRYHVLKIKPFGNRSDNEAQGGSHASPALHIRRGHFKTYTDAAPRFGRDVGTYWYEQALVGIQSNRVVVKDYELDFEGAK